METKGANDNVLTDGDSVYVIKTVKSKGFSIVLTTMSLTNVSKEKRWLA